MKPRRAATCTGRTEVYSRVTGFYRPVDAWNAGKQQEFADRRTYDMGPWLTREAKCAKKSDGLAD
jgi:ribonucleoside-triphosphate reductase (formate)